MVKILSIEDNLLNRNLIRRYFKNSDIQLMEADTGTGGIEAAQEKHPDLILLDFNLPDMDGKAVAHTIREMSDFANVPIIGLTAYDNRVLRLQMLEEGFNEVLYKPVNAAMLMQTIKAHLSH
jgi:DNA-binding response OmpR family regulator